MPVGNLGPYTLLRKLATGGMAEVFLARDGRDASGRNVVVKRILPGLGEDPEFVELFLNEARVTAQLHHPNIAGVSDLGRVDGALYICMELVEGPNLRDILRVFNRSRVALGEAQAVRIIADACKALGYAHDARGLDGAPLNVVHRDVSLDNILLSRHGEVKVVDFGIAKAASASHITRSGMVRGKISYVAPERLAGQPADRRADVFALGVCLFELLTGVSPFAATSEIAMMQAIISSAPASLHRVRPTASPELSRIIGRALEKDPQRRYPACAVMQEELEALLVRTPVAPESLASIVTEAQRLELQGPVESAPKPARPAVPVEVELPTSPELPASGPDLDQTEAEIDFAQLSKDAGEDLDIDISVESGLTHALPRVRQILSQVSDRELAAHLDVVFGAADLCIASVRSIDLTRYEVEQETAQDLGMWEELAPAVAKLIAAMNGLLAEVTIHLPPPPPGASPSPPAVAAIHRHTASLREELAAFNRGLRRSEIVASRWNLLTYLQEGQLKFLVALSELVFEGVRSFREVKRAEVVPHYQATIEESLAVRRAMIDLTRVISQHAAGLAKAAAAEVPARLQALERDLRAFAKTATYACLWARDKQAILRTRARLTQLASRREDLALARKEVATFAGFVKQLGAVNGAFLESHDRELAAELLAELEKAAEMRAPERVRGVIGQVHAAAWKMYGRDVELDRHLRQSMKRGDKPSSAAELNADLATLRELMVRIQSA
ncbi:MAG: serine/threonine protein kinase [Deltaproteobacteria bacterium]|nr:serine/threonine protein kinase [Deltaproteobacteria bacterium]